MKTKFKWLLALVALVASVNVWGAVTWTRVTTVKELTDGGTFIMGYEATAKSGVIVPLRSADCGATTTANGIFNTGTTANSSTSGTIDMSKVTTTADYEVYITSSTSGKINIQMVNGEGSFYGATSGGSTKNTGRLYAAGNSAETNLTPEFSSETNNQFKLTSDVTGQYKYLKYNTGSPRFAYYNSAGSNIVFYKKDSGDDPDPTEPSLSVSPATIDFGTVYQNATVDAEDVTVTFANLTTNDVAAAISGSAFSVDKTSSFTSGDKITITPSTANLGEYEETLTLSATGVDDQTVTIKMNVVEAPAPTGTFELYEGALVAGEYVIFDANVALKNSITSNRFDNFSVTLTDGKIVNPDASIIWSAAKDGDYWTFYNDAVEKYMGAGTSKNTGAVLESVTDFAKWTYDNGALINLGRSTSTSDPNNKYLRHNGASGWASYASGTGTAPKFYKKKAEGNVPVTGVSLPATAFIKTGGTQQLNPTFAPGDATNKNVTWEVTDGSDYIEISTTGLVTAKAEGEGTVKVTTEDGGFTATCVVTVKDGIANTKETAYTVAQALALYDAGFDLEATVYVKGVITSITGTGKNNIYIKDAEQSNSFEFYGLVDGDATVSSLTQYDTIIGHGQLDKFNATYEFKSGCVLDERKAYVAPTILIDPTNTPETAYTPAKAIEIYDNGAQYDLTKAVYVKGVVTTKPSFTTSGDWKGSYYQVVVAAAGTETPTFTFFHMFAGAESAKFTEDVVNAKDTVIAYGTLTKYNTTYELAERCYMYERKPYQAQVTGVTIDNKEGLTVAAHESITLTATIAEAGATGTLVWSVIAGDTYASVDQTGKVTGLAAGEATIQVKVDGTEFTDNCTVTVTAAYEGATLPYSFDDGRNSTDPAFSQNGLGSDYSSSPKLKFDGAEDEVVFHIAEAPAYMSFDIKGNGYTAGQFDVLESADNETYTTLASYTDLASDKETKAANPAATTRYIKFVYTTKNAGNVALGNINILATAPKQDPEFTIANVDVVVDDMAALQITTNSDGAVTYTIDPDNEGIEIDGDVVYAYTEGTYTVTANKAETETYNAAQTTFTVSVSSVAYKTVEVSTFSAVDGGLLELGQFHSYKGEAGTAPVINNNHIRLYQIGSGKSSGGYITISALPGLKIAKIDISTATATSYNYKVDAAEDYTLTEATALAANATANIAGLSADSVRIYCLGADNKSRFDVSYLKVYYTGELETVSALAVDGAEVTEYEIGDEVDHTGAVVTATFATAGDVDVTLNSTFTDPDMSTPGTKQVTANFAEQTATYDITIAAETPEIEVDVTSVGFGTVAQNDEVDAKTVAVTLKAIAEATVEVSGEGASAFNVTPASLTESGNITITPVTTAAGEFTATITISADGAESKTVTVTMNVTDGNLPKEKVDFTEVYSDITGTQSADFVDYTGVTFSIAVAKNDGSQPKYYANGSSVRAYAKNTITISSEKTIAFVLINYTNAKGEDAKASVDAGNIVVNEKYGMWTLGAKEGTLTVGATCSFDNITVYYEYDEVVRSAQSENQIGTGCQTLDIVAVKGATLYQVNYTTGSYLDFMEVTYPVKAGMPIIMQADNTNDGKIEVIYGEKNEEAVAGLNKDGLYGYIGTTQFDIPNDEGCYVFKGGMLRPALDNYTTSGHAYVKLSEVPTEDQLAESPAPRRRMSVGIERSMPTGFETIMMQKGMNKVIMNNQLYLIRDGKLFNAQGALVK